MKKIINFNKFKIKFLTLNYILIILILIPVLIFTLSFTLQTVFLSAPAFAAVDKEIKNAVKSEKKEVKKNTKDKKIKNTPIKNSDDEIIADEDDEIDIDSDNQTVENKIIKNKTGFSFNYTAESRIDKINRDRMKGKIFLEKISNDYFKIYADDDDFIVIADFPYGKENTTHTIKFVDEHKLIVTFKNKINTSLPPTRYEISFPEATKKEVFDFSVRDKLELIVPIDFFYIERKNFR
jgi:c-di-AMP phosphodiesterase-like protein